MRAKIIFELKCHLEIHCSITHVLNIISKFAAIFRAMRTGIIDIGTNTFHLLIAEPGNLSNIIHDEKVPVRLGMGGISEGFITDAATERAIRTLTDFKVKMDELKVEKVITTATSAVRSASNRQSFIQTIQENTGFEIQVLNGEDEALLIHQGVKQSIDFGTETGLIVDIGGGSIEFIVADAKEIQWLKSYEIGGQRLMDKFHKSDPITVDEIASLNAYLDDTLDDMLDASRLHKATFLAGSAGSFDTFWDIHRLKHGLSATSRPVLSKAEYNDLYLELMNKDRQQRMQIPGMIEMRVDMIVGAAVVTKFIMDQTDFHRIEVSPFALKEGILTYGLPQHQ